MLDNNLTDKYIISKAMGLLGSRKTKAKAAASRKNGKLGGRPRGNKKHLRINSGKNKKTS